MKRYKIHEVAEQLGISASAIRYYEKMGLIAPVKDPENGYRTFDQYDIYRLWNIIYYREFGLSLEDICRLRDSNTWESVDALVKNHKAETMRRIEKEKRQLGAWNYYERLLYKANRAGQPPMLLDTGDIHIFRRETFYDKTKTLFSFINLLYCFPFSADENSDNFDYCMLYDDDIRYIMDADKSTEEYCVPSFQAYTMTASFPGDLDEKRALTMALDKAEEMGFAVSPPYYVIYLLSIGDWEHPVRYYEVLLSPADEY